jgi:predicted kinase
MLGYPGAGKSTAAGIIQELTHAVRLSSDDVRVELFPQPTFSQTEHDSLYRTLNERTETLLRQGKDVIYDANLNRLQHRREKYDICKRTGATPVLLWVQAPRDVAKGRAMHDSRSHLWPPGETPNAMFERIADIIEEPGDNEPYITLDGTQLTPDYIRSQLNIT